MMNLLENLTEKQIKNFEDKLDLVEINSRKYRTIKDYKPDIIIGLSFGTTSYNDRLAQAVKDAEDYFGFGCIIAQSEIYQSYTENFNRKPIKIGNNNSKESLWKSDLTTRDVLLKTKDLLNKYAPEYNNILYVAHPAHIYRVLHDGKKLDLEGKPFIEDEIIWSDKKDIQKWTTSQNRWPLREILARVKYNLEEIF
ncbi:hypothetical protein JW949_00580 [Candidatus Woesearchaeota archaeon]|nr:hypothetical protein [Candidatus Woesearchaeota archaeon]